MNIGTCLNFLTRLITTSYLRNVCKQVPIIFHKHKGKVTIKKARQIQKNASSIFTTTKRTHITLRDKTYLITPYFFISSTILPCPYNIFLYKRRIYETTLDFAFVSSSDDKHVHKRSENRKIFGG